MATTTVVLPSIGRPARAERVGGRGRAAEIHFVKAIDNSQVRREVDPRARREAFALLGLSLLIFSLLFVYAWQHFQCVRYGYDLEQLRQQQASLEEWNRHLRLEKAALENPERIGTLAREQLGLVPLDPRQVIPLARSADASAPSASAPELAGNLPAAVPLAEGAAREP